MSTNIQRLRTKSKQHAGGPELKTRSERDIESDHSKPETAAQKSATRGRPRLEVIGQVVSCRLPAEELRAFDALCAQLGAKSRSDGLRSVARMASGFLEFSREDSTRLEEIRYELAKIGTNVNQIALAANRRRVSLVRSQWAAVEELRQALPTVSRTLGQVISERRRQGVALFRKFAETEGAGHG